MEGIERRKKMERRGFRKRMESRKRRKRMERRG